MVLQLGGQYEDELAAAAARSMPWEYIAINLNCGCPSPAVAGKGCFGAALMRDHARVARACAAMRDAVGDAVPITVKCRLGVLNTEAELVGDTDDEKTYNELCDFVHTVSRGSGVRRFVVHARKAILSGLTPRANRQVPPLRRDLVIRLALEFPELSIVLNGGLNSLAEASAVLNEHGDALAGVMCGRAVAACPWDFAAVDTRLFDATCNPAHDRRRVLQAYVAHAAGAEELLEAQLAAEKPDMATAARHRQALRFTLLRHVKNLFAGEPGGRRYRNSISEAEQTRACRELSVSVAEVLAEAMARLPDEVLDAAPGEGPLHRRAYDSLQA